MIWKLTEAGHAAALAALVDRGMKVDPIAAPLKLQIWIPDGLWFEARRGRAAHVFVVTGDGELSAFYRLTWPWRWRAERRALDEMRQTFDGCCERIL